MANGVTKKTEEAIRKFAISLIRGWAEIRAERYVEPSRAGTPKGDRIGFSRKKYKAALLMVLYPNCLKLKEIAKISEVSEGVLRVWRTEVRFKALMEKEHCRLGEALANTIEYHLKRGLGKQVEPPKNKPFIEITCDDPSLIKLFTYPGSYGGWWIAILPLLNPSTSTVVFDQLSNNWPAALSAIKDGLRMFQNVRDDKTLGEWCRNPRILEAQKKMIAFLIDNLVDSIKKGEKDHAQLTKDTIFGILDILAC